jgi:predicted DNA-binding protein
MADTDSVATSACALRIAIRKIESHVEVMEELAVAANSIDQLKRILKTDDPDEAQKFLDKEFSALADDLEKVAAVATSVAVEIRKGIVLRR